MHDISHANWQLKAQVRNVNQYCIESADARMCVCRLYCHTHYISYSVANPHIRLCTASFQAVQSLYTTLYVTKTTKLPKGITSRTYPLVYVLEALSICLHGQACAQEPGVTSAVGSLHLKGTYDITR